MTTQCYNSSGKDKLMSSTKTAERKRDLVIIIVDFNIFVVTTFGVSKLNADEWTLPCKQFMIDSSVHVL